MTDKWNVSGTYFESCNCNVACPCVFLSDPTHGECKVLFGWHIDNGQAGDVTLDGLNVALFVYTPGNMTQGKWKVALYVDERASEEQNGTLAKIFSGQAGGHISNLAPLIEEVLGVKTTVIEYKAEGKHRSLRIPDLVDIEIEAIVGQGNADVTLNNHPLTVVPGHTAVVSKSKQLSYKDHGFQMELSDTNGFYSPFTYQSS
ncbi:hypothetical protein LCGC14_3134220 [marine sediment metagenome]|uniref:DUF1326 domain-containing protein n=1 Tax=marine sediment metagenome TaxID=412755 RepID=A0A0F8WMP7_9ZZZZ